MKRNNYIDIEVKQKNIKNKNNEDNNESDIESDIQVDSNININSRCICKKTLYDHKQRILMYLPCQHLISEDCYKSHQNKIGTDSCHICDENISQLIDIKDVKKFNLNKQFYYDLLSVTNIDDKFQSSAFNILDNLYDIFSILYNGLIKTKPNIKSVSREVLSLNNTTVYVNGLEKINSNNNEKRIFISNHSTYLDMIVISSFINTCFLTSAIIKDTFLGNKLKDVVPCMVIKRGDNGNTVDRIKKYMKTHGSLCIFPEGHMSNPNTLCKFRSGAFNTGYPVQPIVIKYKTLPQDAHVSNFICKLASRGKVELYIDILDMYYPPFSDTKIEQIRQDMANVGNFYLSRVSSRDIQD